MAYTAPKSANKRTAADGFDLIMQDGARANDYLSSLPPQSESDAAESKAVAIRMTGGERQRSESDQEERSGPVNRIKSHQPDKCRSSQNRRDTAKLNSSNANVANPGSPLQACRNVAKQSKRALTDVDAKQGSHQTGSQRKSTSHQSSNGKKRILNPET